jgi:hypothetical protein
MSHEARIRWATRATATAGFAYIAALLVVGHGTLTFVLSVLCLITMAAQVTARYLFLRYQVADLIFGPEN